VDAVEFSSSDNEEERREAILSCMFRCCGQCNMSGIQCLLCCNVT
jgi:hypothetical protein